MDFPVPPASANWHQGVPPEIYNQIVQRQRQWAMVQVKGFSPVIYVNCLEGQRLVEVLRKGLPNDFWQEAHVTGGSGGGANHPNGVILLGPEGLAPFRVLFNTRSPPDLKTETASKLNEGTLRVVPPTTYLKMCQAYKKGTTYQCLRVVGPRHPTQPAQNVADFFQYGGNQALYQAPAPQQSPQPPLQPTAGNNNASSQPLLRSTPANNNARSHPADTAMNATLVTAASRFEGESDADTANTTNAAAALNQMGCMRAAGGEGHTAPSTIDPGPSSNEGDRVAETPAAKRQRVESRFEAVQGLLQQKRQAWIKAGQDADAADAERRAAEVQVNTQEQAQQRELAEIRQQIQQLQKREQSLVTALGEVEKTRRRERQELQERAEQLRAAEAAAERDLHSFLLRLG